MKCEYCGADFDSVRKKKYCSRECCRAADRDNKRINYVGKRQKVCAQCGKDLPKFKTRFCSLLCQRVYSGAVQEHGELLKICVVCGKKFHTFKSRKICCSPQCSKVNHNKSNPERTRARYKRLHPNARSMDQVIKESQDRKIKMRADTDRRKVLREIQQKKAQEIKQKQKQERIEYWQQYSAIHFCEECGQAFPAFYPLTKYCSSKCANAAHRSKDRLKNITIDKGISVKRIARRDKNLCQLCGRPVDWNDYVIKDGVQICGDYYPSRDHIIPISKGGLHKWDNVQLAHRICNIKKSNRL